MLISARHVAFIANDVTTPDFRAGGGAGRGDSQKTFLENERLRINYIGPCEARAKILKNFES